MLSGQYYGLLLGLGGMLVLVVPTAENATSYFPPASDQPSCVDEYRSPHHPDTLIREVRVPVDDGYRSWFEPYFRAAGEPSLYLASTGQVPRDVSSSRFTLTPGWNGPPVIVRVDSTSDGYRLFATQLNHGGEASGVMRRMERRLTASETERLIGLLNEPALFANAGGACVGGPPDTSSWLLERQHGRDYDLAHYVYFEDGGPGVEAHAAGLYMMQLTGWDLEPRY